MEIFDRLLQKNPIIAYAMMLNLICFVLMSVDKLASIFKMRRISERVLCISALAFGAIGGCCSMWLFNHKIKKRGFKYGFPLIAIIQFFMLYILITSNWDMKSIPNFFKLIKAY